MAEGSGQSIFSTHLPGFGGAPPLDVDELRRLQAQERSRHEARHSTHETALAVLQVQLAACQAQLTGLPERIAALELATKPKSKPVSGAPVALVDGEGEPWLDPDGKPLLDNDERLSFDANGEIVLDAQGAPLLKPAPTFAPPSPSPAPQRRFFTPLAAVARKKVI